MSLTRKNAEILSFYVALKGWVVTLDTGYQSTLATTKTLTFPAHVILRGLLILLFEWPKVAKADLLLFGKRAPVN